MDINTLRSISTVICFVMFIGICWWAYRGKNAQRFEEDAMLPFALDNVQPEVSATRRTTEEGAQR